MTALAADSGFRTVRCCGGVAVVFRCCCSVAEGLRWCCGSVAVVRAVVPVDGPVGGPVTDLLGDLQSSGRSGGQWSGPVSCPVSGPDLDSVGDSVGGLVSLWSGPCGVVRSKHVLLIPAPYSIGRLQVLGHRSRKRAFHCRGFRVLRWCCGAVAVPSVAVLLRRCCGSVAVVRSVIWSGDPVGAVGGPSLSGRLPAGPVGCPVSGPGSGPVSGPVGDSVSDPVGGLVGAPVCGLVDGAVGGPVRAVCDPVESCPAPYSLWPAGFRCLRIGRAAGFPSPRVLRWCCSVAEGLWVSGPSRWSGRWSKSVVW